MMRRWWMLVGAGLVLVAVVWWWLPSTPPAGRTRTLAWDQTDEVHYFEVDLDGQVRRVAAPATGAPRVPPRVPICVPLGRPVTIRVRACTGACSPWITTQLELAPTDPDGEPCTP